MKKLDLASSVILLSFSLVVCREAYKLSLGRPAVPGAGLYPFLLGVILFVLSALFFLKSLRGLGSMGGAFEPWKGTRWKKVIFVVIVLFAYGLLLERIGFLICTFLLLMALFRFVDRQRWYWVYGGGLAITIICYVVFKIWLKIQLPGGYFRL